MKVEEVGRALNLRQLRMRRVLRRKWSQSVASPWLIVLRRSCVVEIHEELGRGKPSSSPRLLPLSWARLFPSQFKARATGVVGDKDRRGVDVPWANVPWANLVQ